MDDNRNNWSTSKTSLPNVDWPSVVVMAVLTAFGM